MIIDHYPHSNHITPKYCATCGDTLESHGIYNREQEENEKIIEDAYREHTESI